MSNRKYITTVGGLLELLTEIKEKCGEQTPVQVNVIGTGCVTGLTSVCLDNDTGDDEAIVYIETNPDLTYYPVTFEFYTIGKEL